MSYFSHIKVTLIINKSVYIKTVYRKIDIVVVVVMLAGTQANPFEINL